MREAEFYVIGRCGEWEVCREDWENGEETIATFLLEDLAVEYVIWKNSK